MHKLRTLAGMDVHERSVTCAALDVETDEQPLEEALGQPKCRQRGRPAIAAATTRLPCLLIRLCGLRQLGYACDVIAVSTLPKSPKSRQKKCEGLDAQDDLRPRRGDQGKT